MNRELLYRFVQESNAIEDIRREPSTAELDATAGFLRLGRRPTVENLEELVSVYQPGAILRERLGQDVRVGSYVPPPGQPKMREWLEQCLEHARTEHPWDNHVAYETLHPFSDGNGRSGRALWAWAMLRQGLPPGIELGFLRAFYYQTLERSRR